MTLIPAYGTEAYPAWRHRMSSKRVASQPHAVKAAVLVEQRPAPKQKLDRISMQREADQAALRAVGFVMRPLIIEICSAYGMHPSAVLARSRKHPVVKCRHEIMWRAYELGMSLPKIGRRLGRDHTTVIHGINRHAIRNGLTVRGNPPSAKRFLFPRQAKGDARCRYSKELVAQVCALRGVFTAGDVAHKLGLANRHVVRRIWQRFFIGPHTPVARSKFSQRTIELIRAENGTAAIRDLARRYGVSPRSVRRFWDMSPAEVGGRR